jgi:hypothetical protein
VRRRDIWADFNDVDESGVARTLQRFAEPGIHVAPGVELLVGDAEGNLCKGRVIDITEKGVVSLELDLGTFDAEGVGELARVRC